MQHTHSIKKEMTGLDVLKDRLEGKGPLDVLRFAYSEYGDGLVFASSMSVEDMALADMISRVYPGARTVAIDTGRLHEETRMLMDDVREIYGLSLEVVYPDKKEVEVLVSKQGMYGFKETVESRRECCRVRKINPLKEVLVGASAWITGLRRGQSPTRNSIEVVEEDTGFGLVKINPLWNWSESRVWSYVKKHNVPYNTLYDKGYASIGCIPCTRPVEDCGHVRSGRWWWEDSSRRECGLHR